MNQSEGGILMVHGQPIILEDSDQQIECWDVLIEEAGWRNNRYTASQEGT